MVVIEPGTVVHAQHRGRDVEAVVTRVCGIHVECEDTARDLWWWTTKDDVEVVGRC
jgi:hypothetical protein